MPRTETITRTFYRFDELNGDAQEHAIERIRDRIASSAHFDYVPWQDEIIDSLKAVFSAAGITLTNYSIGMYSESYVRFQMDDGTRMLTGARAMAWLEHNLLADLRRPWVAASKRRPGPYEKLASRFRKNAPWNMPGAIPPCPFTGVCFDDDMLDALRKAIRDGDDLADAFYGLADVARNILEKEYEYETSDEAIRETIEANEYEFTEEGDIA